MKENEIPEKIYLSYETDDEDYKDHIFIDYMWHRHPFEGKNLKNVEYIRTDALIEKVANYLNSKLYDWVRIGHPNPSVSPNVIIKQDFIEDFKNDMKGV